MKVVERFIGMNDLAPTVAARLDKNFRGIVNQNSANDLVKNFVDATSGPVTFNLPDGFSSAGVDYYIIKTDASANAVTIVPFGTQTLEGQPSCTLGAQWAGVWFTFYAGMWYLVSFVI